MNKHEGPSPITCESSATEINGVGVVTRGSHIPLDWEIIDFGAEVDVKAADFDARAQRIGDLNQQITCPRAIGIDVGVRQVNGH